MRYRKWTGLLATALGMGLILACAAAHAASVTYTKQTTKVKGHKITIFSKPTDDSGGALRIVEGGGKTLWFSELALGTVVKFSFNGKATAYTVPIPGASIHSLALGPDQNIWFADFNSNKVGRVSASGKFKTFDTTVNPTASNQMIGAIGGVVWFVTDHSGIGRTNVNPARQRSSIF
jgi:streptogramin lyase